ncbi:hypothetical protein DFJ73DRAFT_859445 [Zopfochytrium polystomum]|nr:hypothetical protein DFJ73DRAFT_859445 [Zopfochytrium polystomum]
METRAPVRESKSRVSYHYHRGHRPLQLWNESIFMKPTRVRMTHSLISAYGLHKKITPDDTEEIQKFQTRFNVGDYCPDCPVFEGIYEFCMLSAGGSIDAALHRHTRPTFNGDGVEEAFYTTDRVMTVSFHTIRRDVGVGKGRHYSVNVPLNDGVDDESYVVLQLGADSLIGDRLGCFNLSMRGHGHSVENVARAWCYETSLALGVEIPDELPYHEYFEGYGPEYRLDIPASNMENLNSGRILKNIQNHILESLRHVAHAPSVELHHIPSDRYSDDDDSETNDVRITRHEALSDSEEEGEGGRRDRISFRFHQLWAGQWSVLVAEECGPSLRGITSSQTAESPASRNRRNIVTNSSGARNEVLKQWKRPARRIGGSSAKRRARYQEKRQRSRDGVDTNSKEVDMDMDDDGAEADAEEGANGDDMAMDGGHNDMDNGNHYHARREREIEELNREVDGERELEEELQ